MDKYIFTFGSGQLYAGYYQPIYAENGNLARAKMVEMHGVKWGFQYTEDEWKKTELEYGILEQPLQAVYCTES